MKLKLLLLSFLYLQFTLPTMVVVPQTVTVQVVNPVINNLAVETFVKFFDEQDVEVQEKLLKEMKQKCESVEKEKNQLDNIGNKFGIGSLITLLGAFATVPCFAYCGQLLPPKIVRSNIFQATAISSFCGLLFTSLILVMCGVGFKSMEEQKAMVLRTIKGVYDLCAFKYSIKTMNAG